MYSTEMKVSKIGVGRGEWGGRGEEDGLRNCEKRMILRAQSVSGIKYFTNILFSDHFTLASLLS